MTWTTRWKKRLRALGRKDAVERELEEELAFHLEMETRNNLRAGMRPEEARRRAVLRFGGVERVKEEVRDARGLAWLVGMALDFRLGGRMLLKYPGLTVVGTLAITFAICLGVGTFEFVARVIHPTIPLPQGERVVGIRSWDAARSEMRASGVDDFVGWRDAVRSVEAIGAYRTVDRNLIDGDGRGEAVEVAEISASAFRIDRRGTLAPGNYADLVAFDKDTVGVESYERVHDLPAGAERIIAHSAGIEHVWINGTPTRVDGADVDGVRPGQPLVGVA